MNASDQLKLLLTDLLTFGKDVPSRVGATKELNFVHFKVTDPLDRYITTPSRKVSVPAQIAETMWVLAGRNDVEWLSAYLPQAAKFADDGKHWRAGYGPRLRAWKGGNINQNSWSGGIDQVQQVIRLLKEDLNTRRAVMSLWDPSSDYASSLDIPCNNWLHFLYRDGKLNLSVAIRSNDVMWGWSGINFFEWSVLLEIVAHHAGLEVGSLHFYVGSLHLYERHFEKAKRIVDAPTMEEPIIRYDSRYKSDNLDADIDLWFKLEADIRRGIVSGISSMGRNPLFHSWLWAIASYWGYEGEGGGMLADPIWPALALSPKRKVAGPDPLDDLIRTMQALHTEKSAAYGDSWKKRGELFSIIPNIARKVDRILAGTETSDETKLDTAMDLVIYLAKYDTWLKGASSLNWTTATLEAENEAIASLMTEHSKNPALDQLESCFEGLLKIVERADSTAQTKRFWLLAVIAQAVGYLVTLSREKQNA